jgi:hypothetical protein
LENIQQPTEPVEQSQNMLQRLFFGNTAEKKD